MDPKSEWALGEFRDAPIELRLLEHTGTNAGGIPQQEQRREGSDSAAAAAAAGGGRRRALSIRSAYQGERLAGLLVVKFDAGVGEQQTFLIATPIVGFGDF